MGVKKIIYTKQGDKFYVKDIEKDFHTSFGFIKKEDLKEAKTGSAQTNLNKEVFIINPSFIDVYGKLKRSAQIIHLKDIGEIIATAGINKNSIVIDAGSGSGALACFLAHIVNKVYTYDIREDHLEIAKKNMEILGLKNITAEKCDVYESIPEKNADLVTLDLGEPWKAIDSAYNALKTGGFLVSYSPCIPQVMDFVNKINEDKRFVHIKTVELIRREWEVDGRKVRPKTLFLNHTGFLSFARKIQ